MAQPFDPSRLTEALRRLRAALPPDLDERLDLGLPARELTRLLAEIVSAQDSLEGLATQLDPIRPPPKVLDPTDPKTTAMLIGKLLEELQPVPLDSIGRFYGSGVYAIYYDGEFSAYGPIQGTLCPIYVGKADPSEPKARTPREQGPRISGRLAEHAKSIRRATNLNLPDFTCRYLVVQSGWQKGAEDYLIQVYQPVWNVEVGVCAGIGKHGDTARTERSAWDILHPGRPWAARQRSRSGQTPETVARDIESHFVQLCREDPERWLEILDQDWVRVGFNR